MAERIAVMVVLESDDPELQMEKYDPSTAAGVARMRRAIVRHLKDANIRIVAFMSEYDGRLMLSLYDMAKEEAEGEGSVLRPPLAERDHLCNAILAQPGLSSATRTRLLDIVNREAGIGSRLRWPFMMVNPERFVAVSNWIMDNSHRPAKTAHFWARCLVLAEVNDGNVPIERTELAADMGVSPKVISEMLGYLVRCNALIRERKNGAYRYRLNRLVGTNIAPEEIREALQIQEPEIVGVVGLWPYDGSVAGRDDVIVQLHPIGRTK